MRCPKCGARMHVYRTDSFETCILRIRQCEKCVKRIMTWETFDEKVTVPEKRRGVTYAEARTKAERNA